MRLYLSGPMTGLPDFNYPLFNAVATLLRERGHTVLNPAENPVPPCGTWEGYMRLALAQLVQPDDPVQCIVLLPGWAESRGALLERSVAQALGIDIAHFTDPQVLALVPLLTAMDVPAHRRCAVDWSAA